MSLENIEFLMDTAGIALVFPTFQIRGLPGFLSAFLRKGQEDVYGVDIQEWEIQVLSSDVLTFNLKVADEFYFIDTLDSQKLHFSIENNPIPDGTGFCRLVVSLLKVEPNA